MIETLRWRTWSLSFGLLIVMAIASKVLRSWVFVTLMLYDRNLTMKNLSIEFWFVNSNGYCFKSSSMWLVTTKRCPFSQNQKRQSHRIFRMSRFRLLFCKIISATNLVDIFSIQWTCGNPRNIWKNFYFE